MKINFAADRKKRSRFSRWVEKQTDKVKHTYWNVIPYDWRPGQIWYRFKCWAWKRHTTVKPRYLPHTWCDRCSILPHMMFEILSQFIEKECSPGIVEWYGENGHKITVDGTEKYVMDEMKDLCSWWHEIYNKEYERVDNVIWELIHTHNLGPQGDWDEMNDPLVDDDGEVYAYRWNPKYETAEKETLYHMLLNALNRLEREQHEDLEEKMIRLCKLRAYMWT